MNTERRENEETESIRTIQLYRCERYRSARESNNHVLQMVELLGH